MNRQHQGAGTGWRRESLSPHRTRERAAAKLADRTNLKLSGWSMAASVWTGYLTFGLISMPVRLFSGARGTRVSFHMLHRDDNARVKQQLYCPVDEKVIERNEIVKGYEFRKGEYVVVEPEEIKKIEPKTAKAMEILEFVKQEEIDPVYFESSYYLAPDEAAKKPYTLLV